MWAADHRQQDGAQRETNNKLINTFKGPSIAMYYFLYLISEFVP